MIYRVFSINPLIGCPIYMLQRVFVGRIINIVCAKWILKRDLGHMKIIGVDTTLLAVPRDPPVADSTAKALATGGHCFVHIHTDSGLEGLGMSAASRAVQAVIEDDLTPLLIGKDPLDIEGLWQEMFWGLRSLGRKGVAIQALSAVDIALWDVKARSFELPLYKLLGQVRDTVPVYGSGGWTSYSDDELVEEQTGYVDRGFDVVKMKVGMAFGQEPATDMRRLQLVRDAVGPNIEILVDANNGYSAKQAILMADRFREIGIGWLEEPVAADDIDGLARVTAACRVPIATGEHEYTKWGFKDLLARSAMDIAQPDVGRVGGITEWLKVASLADAHGIPVAPHSYQLVHRHLCMAIPNLKIVEYLGTRECEDEIVYLDWEKPTNGIWRAEPGKYGLGLELDPEAIQMYRVS